MHVCIHADRDRQKHTQTGRDRRRQTETERHTYITSKFTLYYTASHHINYITSHYSTVHTYKLQYICIHYSSFIYMCHTCHMTCDRQTHARLTRAIHSPKRFRMLQAHGRSAAFLSTSPWRRMIHRGRPQIGEASLGSHIILHCVSSYNTILHNWNILYIYILLYYILCYFLSYYILVYYDSWDVAPFMLHHHFPTIIAIRRFTLFRDTHMHVYFQPCNQREGNTIIFRTVKKTWTKQNSLKNHVSMGRVTNVFHMCIYIYIYTYYIYTHIIYIYIYIYIHLWLGKINRYFD